MSSTRNRIVCVLSCVVFNGLTGCTENGPTATGAGSGSNMLVVGELHGDIRFEPASTEVLNYVSASNPRARGVASVSAKEVNGPIAADTLYTIGAANVGANLASYTMTPTVDPAGTSFSLTTDFLEFNNSALYLFGTYDSAAPDALISSPVLPLSDEPSGTAFDLAECAVRVNVMVTVGGDPADLDALDSNAYCAVFAEVEEIAGSFRFVDQARSERMTCPVSDLRGSGVSIPILVRADATLQFTASGGFSSSDPGFPRIPVVTGSWRDWFIPDGGFGAGAETGSMTFACGDDNQQVDIEIPIERNAGTLSGNLDVVGMTDTEAVVRTYPWPGLAPVDTSVPGPHPWEFEAIPAGPYSVFAETRLDNGEAVVQFPELAGPYDVDVAQGMTTDLGNAFVVAPYIYGTRVTLEEQRPGSRLQYLALGPIRDFVPRPLRALSNLGTSWISAAGMPGVYVSNGTLGVDAIGADSYARFNGAYDTVTMKAELDADLILVGLSAAGGADDGTDALPANWKPSALGVRLFNEDPYVNQNTTVQLNVSNSIDAVPQQRVDDFSTNVCFGELSRSVIAPQGFDIFDPQLHLADADLVQPIDLNGIPVVYDDVSGQSYSLPRTAGDAVNLTTTAITVPAYMQYETLPILSVIPEGGGTFTSTSASRRLMPASGYLQCADDIGACSVANTEDNESSVSDLFIDLRSKSVFCEGDAIPIDFVVESTGANPAQVDVTFGTNPPETQCGGNTSIACTNPFNGSHTVSAVPPGSYRVSIEALANIEGQPGLTCPAHFRRWITVEEAPKLMCPENISVPLMGNEDGVPYERIAERLQAEWSDGCVTSNLPTIVSDHPLLFSRGETTVSFTSPADGSPLAGQMCTTTVTVEPPDACNDLTTLQIGPLIEPLQHGNVTYRPLVPGQLFRATDSWGPQRTPNPGSISIPDQQSELAVSQGLIIDLPFAARQIRFSLVNYVLTEQWPIRLEGKDESGNTVHVWESTTDLLQDRRLSLATVSPTPVQQWQLSGGGDEALLLELCYNREPPPLPPFRPGPIIAPGL